MRDKVSALSLVLLGTVVVTGSELLNSGGKLLAAKQPSGQSASNETCLSSDADGRFESAVQASALEPSNASLQHLVAAFYFQRSQDPRLNTKQKHVCLENTLTAEDRA